MTAKSQLKSEEKRSKRSLVVDAIAQDSASALDLDLLQSSLAKVFEKRACSLLSPPPLRDLLALLTGTTSKQEWNGRCQVDLLHL